MLQMSVTWLKVETKVQMEGAISPCGLRIQGCWTKAGIGSCVHIRRDANSNAKPIDFLFDCGIFEDTTSAASHVFVSHSHTDHIGSCILHARARALQRRPAKYYMPAFAVDHLEAARKAFSEMDGRDIPMDICITSPGDVIDLYGQLKVVVFPTVHRVASQGYAVYSTTPRRLKDQYKTLPAPEIKQLVQSDIAVYEDSVDNLEMVYTGDTLMSGLLKPDTMFIFKAPILIMELTYLDGDYSKAIEWGHVHINDIIENESIFENDSIIFVHVSIKYGPFSRILNMLNMSLPEKILQKALVSVKSFGSSSFLSSPLHLSNDAVGWGWGQERRPSSRSHGYKDRDRHDSFKDSGRDPKRAAPKAVVPFEMKADDFPSLSSNTTTNVKTVTARESDKSKRSAWRK